MLRLTLLVALVLLFWNVPETRQFTARSLRTVADAIEPTDTTRTFKDWLSNILN